MTETINIVDCDVEPVSEGGYRWQVIGYEENGNSHLIGTGQTRREAVRMAYESITDHRLI